MDFLHSAGYLPLTRDNWQLLLSYWKYFVLITPVQLLLLPNFYPAGKTSYNSILNVPGKLGWILMELFSPFTLLYAIYTNPERTGALPKSHTWLAFLYCTHYFYRSIISPLRNPSMGPMSIILVLSGIGFNIVNGFLIGGWIGGYGSTSNVPTWRIVSGSTIFFMGLLSNIYHEGILRDIRKDSQTGRSPTTGSTEVMRNGRLYKIPEGGLFRWIWTPHYFSEWIEWAGYIIAGGGAWNFAPAAMFLVNELSTMIPRALHQKRWYQENFSEDILPKREAAIPGVI